MKEELTKEEIKSTTGGSDYSDMPEAKFAVGQQVSFNALGKQEIGTITGRKYDYNLETWLYNIKGSLIVSMNVPEYEIFS